MVATRTITNLASGFTQAQLRDAILAAFVNAGYSAAISNYTSGTDLILVFAFVVDAGKTFGTTYLRVRITNAFVIFQQVFSTWNTGTNTGTGNSTEVNHGTLVNTQAVVFNALDGDDEYRIVALTQNTLFMPLGMICPPTRRGSWDLNSYTCGFIFTSATMAIVRTSTANQYGNSDCDLSLVANARMGTANAVDAERDLLSGLVLLTQANQGFMGKTSDDLAVVSSSGSTRYDTLYKSGSSEQYLLLAVGVGGFAVRIV